MVIPDHNFTNLAQLVISNSKLLEEQLTGTSDTKPTTDPEGMSCSLGDEAMVLEISSTATSKDEGVSKFETKPANKKRKLPVNLESGTVMPPSKKQESNAQDVLKMVEQTNKKRLRKGQRKVRHEKPPGKRTKQKERKRTREDKVDGQVDEITSDLLPKAPGPAVAVELEKWRKRLSKDDPLSRYVQVYPTEFLSGTLISKLAAVTIASSKILESDTYAYFHISNPRIVYHSTCKTKVTMKTTYDTSRWNDHIKTCSVQAQAENSDTINAPNLLLSMASQVSQFSTVLALYQARKPCPGLSADDSEHILTYLHRTGALGGGARSITKMSKEMFACLFSLLSIRDKKDVLLTQQHEQTWKNDHDDLRVFSADCQKKVLSHPSLSRVQPCHSCRSLLRNKRFNTAIRLDTPHPANYIYLNHRFRHPIFGEMYATCIGLKEIIQASDAKNNPAILFALGSIRGDYANFSVFCGLVEAMTVKIDKEKRGVGLQNFRYHPDYDEFCQIIYTHSPKTYRFYREHLPGRTTRSFRMKEARQICFPFEICDQTFTRVNSHIQALNYDGAVGLSCDDTKLNSSFRMFWDAEEKSYLLIGGTGPPLRVADPEQMRQVLDEGNIEKATKLRLWCLTIPLPKVSPIILAAVAIPDDLDATELLRLLNLVLDGLSQHGIYPVSYACDGTETERSVQHRFTKECNRTWAPIRHTSEHPYGGKSLTVEIPRYKGRPIVMLQDSKHAIKTFRNNLFSGARLLVLGNHTASYSDVHELAFADGSPLYRRDVEKLDRQDDNAATRLFSSETLRFADERFPEKVSLKVFLFVFGELGDAYQSRKLSHTERLKMALRARFFLDAWESYLKQTGYKPSLYLLSRQALDIICFIIDGLISLIIVYRDHLKYKKNPLYPWLHSTEACEHVFGEARKLVADFTHLCFVFMVEKLCIRIREAIFRSRTHNSEARPPGQGYNHTYFDSTDSNAGQLSTFPSDSDIQKAAKAAADEADNLLHLLGVSPNQLRQPNKQSTTFPSFASWAPPEELSSIESEIDLDIDHYEEEVDGDESDVPESQILQEYIRLADHLSGTLCSATAARLQHLICAAIALAADDFVKIQSQPNDNELDREESMAEEFHSLHSILDEIADNLPSSVPTGSDEAPLFESRRLDFAAFIEQRELHQTRFAKNGVRIRREIREKVDEGTKDLTPRRKLIHEFDAVLRMQQSHVRITTGVGRFVRWLDGSRASRGLQANDVGLPSVVQASGNSANAAVVFDIEGDKAFRRRTSFFKQSGCSLYHTLGSASVSTLNKAENGCFVFALAGQKIVLGKVTLLYALKSGKHAAILDATNVASISNVCIQVYEQSFSHHFTMVPNKTSRFHTKQFALLRSISLLCLLKDTPESYQNQTNSTLVELTPRDGVMFEALVSELPNLTKAVEKSRKREEKEMGENQT